MLIELLLASRSLALGRSAHQFAAPRRSSIAASSAIMSTASASKIGTRSMFGSQPLSSRGSAPSFGFGSSSREQAAKVFQGQEHAKLSTAGVSSPGPSAYSLRGSVGKQSSSKTKNDPTWKFGSAERFSESSKTHRVPGPGNYPIGGSFGGQVQSKYASSSKPGFGSAEREHVRKVYISEDHQKALHGVSSPGPQKYYASTQIGKGREGHEPNAPGFVFGSANRFRYEHVKRASASPGPGAYALGASVGKQLVSTKHSAPSPGFGTSTRAEQAKLHISKEHAKTASAGSASPGPMAYSLPGSTGIQHATAANGRKTAPSWKMPTAPRFAADKPNKKRLNVTPGPGSYCV